MSILINIIGAGVTESLRGETFLGGRVWEERRRGAGLKNSLKIVTLYREKNCTKEKTYL